MPDNQPYHSALKPPLDCPPADRDECEYGKVLRRDVFRGLGSDFRECDVFYTEPPWPRGFTVFNERAGHETDRTFGDLARQLSGLARSLVPPVIYLVGIGTLSLYKPHDQIEISLRRTDKFRALAISWRLELPRTLECAEDLLAWLAENHDCVGDFMAGYGRTGRIFAGLGKRFVLADLNAHCVGYISQHMRDWGRKE